MSDESRELLTIVVVLSSLSVFFVISNNNRVVQLTLKASQPTRWCRTLSAAAVWLSNGSLNIFIRQITSSSLKMSELADGGREWKGSETQNETTLPLSYKLPCSTHKSHSARRLGSLEVVQFLSLLKIWRKFVWVGGFLMIPHIFHHFRLWKKGAQQKPTMKIMTKRFPFVDNRNENERARLCLKK